jgi:hypothetical protein
MLRLATYYQFSYILIARELHQFYLSQRSVFNIDLAPPMGYAVAINSQNEKAHQRDFA